MPKVSDEQRLKWLEYQRHKEEFWSKVEAKYATKLKRHAECRLCGDMVTDLEPADVFEALKEHEKSHPEYEEWIALSKEFSITDLPSLFHDHDCVYEKCACQCGCQSDVCVADMPEGERNKPTLCDLCWLWQSRGHVEHRLAGQ